jgi:hypothetical protein
MDASRDAGREEIEHRLAGHLHGVRCAKHPAVRAVVKKVAPLQVFDGDVVRMESSTARSILFSKASFSAWCRLSVNGDSALGSPELALRCSAFIVPSAGMAL